MNMNEIYEKLTSIVEAYQKDIIKDVITYSGTSGQSFRKHSDMKPESSGHLVS